MVFEIYKILKGLFKLKILDHIKNDYCDRSMIYKFRYHFRFLKTLGTKLYDNAYSLRDQIIKSLQIQGVNDDSLEDFL